jgi:hypothetical protein
MVFEGCRHGLNGSIEGLKDGLQEVPEGGKWSKRHLSFPGNLCLHLRNISAPHAMQKKAKKPNPHPGPRDYWFPGPPALPNMQSFSTLFSN